MFYFQFGLVGPRGNFPVLKRIKWLSELSAFTTSSTVHNNNNGNYNENDNDNDNGSDDDDDTGPSVLIDLNPRERALNADHLDNAGVPDDDW